MTLQICVFIIHEAIYLYILEFDENDANCLRDLYLCIKPHQGDDYVIPSSHVLFAHCGTLKKSIKKVKLHFDKFAHV